MIIYDFIAFSAEVWGTVSDWIMVTVTAVTAILLFLTFKSQISVQKNQQRITDIEGERFRIEYKPGFELSIQSIDNKTLENHIRSVVHFRIKFINKDCKNFNVIGFSTASSIEKISISKNHIGLTLPIDYISIPEEYNLHFTVNSMTALFPNEGATLIFYLEFEDLIGNRYRQEYIYVFQNAITYTQIKNPVRILI